MRIAFTLFAGRDWLGGYNYLLNFCRVMGKHSHGRMVPIMFAGEDVDEDDLVPFREVGCEVVISSCFNRSQKIGRLFNSLLTGKDTASEQLFIRYRIDVVLEHATYFGWRFSLPTIAWLGDFQHRHLPGMFSVKAYWKRELGMRLQIFSGRTLMVSSEMAKRECKEFFGLSPDKVHTVRFSVPTPTASEQNLNVIRERYGLSRFFFHLPNQFWKHKNHLLVLKALTMLRDTEVVVVATGRCEDLRHPEYFQEVEKFIRSENLENKFKVLGVVPYSDMVGLMQASVAVINPSLFEGWSTTVEEARALGVPLLLSDIPVHHEQMGNQALYFKVDEPEKLAVLLMQCLNGIGKKQGASADFLETDNRAHLNRFVEDFEKTVLASVATVSSQSDLI